jgi:hypothetical protein
MSAFDPKRTLAPFQASDAGSFPFTRCNVFKHLCHLHFVILTSGLLAF